MVAFKHVALLVPDLRAAEEHYRSIFAADLIGRESLRDDGKWYSVPHGRTWADIDDTDVDVHWVGLRRDDLIIALLLGEPEAQRTLYAIGLHLEPSEIAEIHGRLPDDVTVEVHTERALTFVDRHGFRWQCLSGEFQTAGDARGDWLDL
ncbi:MAG: hypothetical protein R3343_01450 [Nitriliruptorales bacterium]|nr:hypothetical protein [Nitriliruptorales bacterium]